MNTKITILLAVALVAGMGYFGFRDYQLRNQLGDIGELRAAIEQGDLTLADQLASMTGRLDELEAATSSLPAIRDDVASLLLAQTEIQSLRRRVRQMQRELDQLELDALRNPIGCFAGRPAVWGFAGLTTCGNIPADAIDRPILCRFGNPAFWGFAGLSC